MKTTGSSLIWPARDVVTTLRVDEPPSLARPFLNLRFAASALAKGNPELSGCGLYCLGLDDRLIYVGEFLGEGDDPFAGNVCEQRWVKHSASVTVRGTGVGSGPRALANAISRRPGCGLLEILNQHPDGYIDKDGFVASENRLVFASVYREIFGDASQHDILGRLTFRYVRVERPDDLGDAHHVWAAVTAAQNKAIEDLKPLINGGCAWREEDQRQSLDNAAAHLEACLLEFEPMFTGSVRSTPTAAKKAASPKRRVPAKSSRAAAHPNKQEGVRELARLVCDALGDRRDQYIVRDHRRYAVTVKHVDHQKISIHVEPRASRLMIMRRADERGYPQGPWPKKLAPLEREDLRDYLAENCP
jgi:hypothetical protein